MTVDVVQYEFIKGAALHRGSVSPQPRVRHDNMVVDDITDRAEVFQHFHGPD